MWPGKSKMQETGARQACVSRQRLENLSVLFVFAQRLECKLFLCTPAPPCSFKRLIHGVQVRPASGEWLCIYTSPSQEVLADSCG